MEEMAVYVPAESEHRDVREAGEFLQIAPGSGIVGELENDLSGMLLVDFEGNLYGAENVVTYADRVYQAFGRRSVMYPTVARRLAPVDMFERVGVFMLQTGEVLLREEHRDLVRRWLGLDDGAMFDQATSLLDSELRCSGHRWER